MEELALKKNGYSVKGPIAALVCDAGSWQTHLGGRSSFAGVCHSCVLDGVIWWRVDYRGTTQQARQEAISLIRHISKLYR